MKSYEKTELHKMNPIWQIILPFKIGLDSINKILFADTLLIQFVTNVL